LGGRRRWRRRAYEFSWNPTHIAIKLLHTWGTGLRELDWLRVPVFQKIIGSVSMLGMPSAVEFIVHHFVIVLFTFGALVLSVVIYLHRPVSAEEAANWPVTEGTIQSVRVLSSRTAQRPDSLYVGDFSYSVNDEYYSGKVKISRSFSTHDSSADDLIDQKIQVRYNPRKPEKFSVVEGEMGGFLLDPYMEIGED
jgi:hypothetical protein